MSTASVTTAFGKAAADNRAALVGYLPAGFPDKDTRHQGRPRDGARRAPTSSRSACPTPTR